MEKKEPNNQTEKELNAKIKETLPGVYKIEHSTDGIHVGTEHCFCDTNRLKKWLKTFKEYDIVNIVIGYRYDRTHGLSYTFQKKEQINL